MPGSPTKGCNVTLPNGPGMVPCQPCPLQQVPSLPQNGDGHLLVEVFACKAWWHLGTVVKCYMLEPEA